MPDHAAKRKTNQNVLSNAKSNVMQDDKIAKENDLSQKDGLVSSDDVGKDDILLVDIPEDNREIDKKNEVKELPKPPYDSMRVEPVLTNLIIEKCEGDVDENGFLNGDACIYFIGGHWYKGPIENKKMNGQGVYCWSDGTIYRGEFSDNTISGNGIYSWPDGSVYEGEVKNGLRHGMGTYKCGTCPSTYIGEWVNGMRHGKGVIYFDHENATYYDGEWTYGIKDGYGVHKYKSGNVYEGQWFDNKRHGKGKMHWLDRGEEYDGEWVEGVQNGEGKHTWYSKRVTVSQYPIRNEYEGYFVNGERHGYGVFHYASGARYSGYWNKNLKSGIGEFMFKNGSVFKGMFENDHIVDYPNLVPSRMTTPEITESGIPVRSQTPLHQPSPDPGSVDTLLDISLKEIFIEEQFDIERQQVELEELNRIVLRYMTPIKHIYKFYSRLGVYDNADNAFIMVRMQFWRLLKDCMLHTLGCTLVEIDLVDGISETKGDFHDPNTQIYVRDFVNMLVNVSYSLFKDDYPDENCSIAKSMLKMLTKYVIPNACIVKGHLFNRTEFTKEALKYKMKCEEVFAYFREMTCNYDLRKALRIRDFLWLLKDFKLMNSSLTVKIFLDAVYSCDQKILEERCFNLNYSIVFLEFFEALLYCGRYFKPEPTKSEDQSEHLRNSVMDINGIKSPSLTKDDDESITADAVMEQQKSPVTASSHDKNTHPPEVSSPNDPVKNEPPPSPSKASELNSHAKTSAVGGSRKDQNTAKEGFSVSGGSRNKRRGTVDNVEADGKLTNAMNTKTKGTKEKEKSNKSSGKSAKKVIIDDCKEKNVTSNASVVFEVDQEQEKQSVVRHETSNADPDNTSNKLSNIKQSENECNSITDQAASSAIEDTTQMNKEDIEQFVNDTQPNSVTDSADNIAPENKPEDSGEDLQLWIDNLKTFFEDHFFPAFELQKNIDRVLNDRRTCSLIN